MGFWPGVRCESTEERRCVAIVGGILVGEAVEDGVEMLIWREGRD